MNGFIGSSPDVTTNKYNTVTEFHTTIHSTLIFSVYFHKSSLSVSWQRIYNTGNIKVSLNHTLPISLYYSTHKVFKSHIKSSQVDFYFFFNSTLQAYCLLASYFSLFQLKVLNNSTTELPWATSYDWLQSQNQSQSQSYFTTGGLPPISSSWRQAPWDPRSDLFFQLNSCGNSPYASSSLIRRWVCLLWICLAFRQVYVSHTYSMLLKMSSLCTTHKSFVSIGFTEQVMPILRILCYNGSLVTWTVVGLTTVKFKPLILTANVFGCLL
jgi:hypothetical protein